MDRIINTMSGNTGNTHLNESEYYSSDFDNVSDTVESDFDDNASSASDFVERDFSCNKCPIHPDYQFNFFCQNCCLPICFQCGRKSHHKHFWKEESSTFSRQQETSEDKCPTHCSRYLKYYCRDCSEFICFDCGQHSHKLHHWDEYKHFAQELTKKTGLRRQSLESEIIPELKKQIENLRFTKEANNKLYQTNIEVIEKVRKFLYAELDSLIDEIKSPYNEKHTEIQNEISSIENKKCEDIEKLQTLTTEETNNEKQIIRNQKAIEDIIQTLGHGDSSFEEKTRFVSSSINRSVLRSMIGHLVCVEEFKLEASGAKPFHSSRIPHHLVPTSTGGVWLFNRGERKVQVLSSDLKIKDELKIPADNQCMAETACRTIYTTDFRNKCLNKVDLLPRKTVSLKYHPTSVTRGKEGHTILLTSVIKKESEHGMVTEMSEEGETLKEYRLDRDGRPLFKRPLKALSSTKDEICVIDHYETEQTKLVFLDSRGCKTWEYKGETQPFFATDIIYDKYNNILCTDNENDQIILLSPNGVFIKYLLSIEKPISLALVEEILFVGQNNGNIHAFRYKN